MFVDRNWAILDVLRAVAGELDVTEAQVALAWVMARPGVASTIIGASSEAQLRGNIAATGIAISEDQAKRLDAASALPPGFTSGLGTKALRRMLFGGHEVTGWGE